MARIIVPPMWPVYRRRTSLLDPRTIAGLQFWYRGSTANASAGNLTGWTDLSGNAQHLNLISVSPPTVVASVLNGKSIVRFVRASSQDARRTPAAAIVGTGGYTIFVVRKAASLGVQQSIVAVDTGASPVGGITIGHTATPLYEIRHLGTGSHSGGTPTTAAFVIERITRSVGAAATLYLNGTSQPVGGGAMTNIIGGPPQICVGSAGAFSEFFDGDIADVLLYAPEITIGQCVNIERGYLGPYYGLTVA